MRGWLGPATGAPELYVRAAHGEEVIDCHMANEHECAGAAIYRSNVCKTTRQPTLDLPADKALVFSRPDEFIAHHTVIKKAAGECKCSRMFGQHSLNCPANTEVIEP